MGSKKAGKISDKNRARLNLLCGHGDCKYAIMLENGICNYAEMTGKLRKCDPTPDCEKYEKTGKENAKS